MVEAVRSGSRSCKMSIYIVMRALKEGPQVTGRGKRIRRGSCLRQLEARIVSALPWPAVQVPIGITLRGPRFEGAPLLVLNAAHF